MHVVEAFGIDAMSGMLVYSLITFVLGGIIGWFCKTTVTGMLTGLVLCVLATLCVLLGTLFLLRLIQSHRAGTHSSITCEPALTWSFRISSFFASRFSWCVGFHVCPPEIAGLFQKSEVAQHNHSNGVSQQAVTLRLTPRWEHHQQNNLTWTADVQPGRVKWRP
jgi:hypothetical protein